MKTKTKILKLAVEKLMEDVEKLFLENQKLSDEIQLIKSQGVNIEKESTTELSKLLFDSKEVQQILGVCYNTLQKIVNKGVLIPIRINDRNIRYTRESILSYLDSKKKCG